MKCCALAAALYNVNYRGNSKEGAKRGCSRYKDGGDANRRGKGGAARRTARPPPRSRQQKKTRTNRNARTKRGGRRAARRRAIGREQAFCGGKPNRRTRHKREGGAAAAGIMWVRRLVCAQVRFCFKRTSSGFLFSPEAEGASHTKKGGPVGWWGEPNIRRTQAERERERRGRPEWGEHRLSRPKKETTNNS